MLLSPARGRGWERGLRELSMPPLLASPPSGGEEYELFQSLDDMALQPLQLLLDAALFGPVDSENRPGEGERQGIAIIG